MSLLTTNLHIPLGETYATPGAQSALEENGQNASEFIKRHSRGDFGEALCEEDREANFEAIQNGSRLFSAYYLRDGQKLWIITEWDRSSTTVLLPEEY